MLCMLSSWPACSAGSCNPGFRASRTHRTTHNLCCVLRAACYVLWCPFTRLRCRPRVQELRGGGGPRGHDSAAGRHGKGQRHDPPKHGDHAGNADVRRRGGARRLGGDAAACRHPLLQRGALSAPPPLPSTGTHGPAGRAVHAPHRAAPVPACLRRPNALHPPPCAPHTRSAATRRRAATGSRTHAGHA